MGKRFLATIIFIGFYQFASAQCTEAITRATNAFDAGHLNDIPAILNECVKRGSAEQKVEALKLLTITYLYLDDPYAAENSFMDLLEVDPEFRVSDNDPIELEYLSRKFITTPIISYNGKLGVNYTTVTLLNLNTQGNENDNNRQYRPKVGFTAAGGFDLHFDRSLSLAFEAEFMYRSYGRNDLIFKDPQKQSEMRAEMYLSVPVMLKYTYGGKKNYLYFPYIYAGYSPSYTLSAYSASVRNLDIEGPGINLKPQMSAFSHSLIFGIGLKRRIKYRYILIDFRYQLGMTNRVAVENYNDFSVQDNKTYAFRYGWVLDDYRLNNFTLTLGYIWPKYKARAKNTVTIQTVLQKWFSKKNKRDE